MMKGKQTLKVQANPAHSGFTLLELLIAIAIIGVLLSIAYPSYQQHLATGYRSQAHQALFDLSARLERFYLEQHSYADATLERLGVPPLTPDGEHYRLDITELSPVTYALTADATPTQANRDTGCYRLTLNQLGQKAAWALSDSGELLPAEGCW